MRHQSFRRRLGRSVLVLEQRHLVGGAAVTEEIFPGFKFSVCSYVVSLLRPEIIRELELALTHLSVAAPAVVEKRPRLLSLGVLALVVGLAVALAVSALSGRAPEPPVAF